MGSETRKLLLIGATGYDRAKEGLRLDCVSWNKLSEVQNVRDYDVLVLNLLSIATEEAAKRLIGRNSTAFWIFTPLPTF
jgi:hypothetical protein